MAGINDPLHFFYDKSNQNLNNLSDQINEAEIGCIIFFGQPSSSLQIIRDMRQKKMNQALFGKLSLLDEEELSDTYLNDYEDVILITSGHWWRSNGSSFRDEYQRLNGKMPGAVAAYAYDGMNLIIEAIRNAGLDRDKIQKSLAKIHYEGVTGHIQFDEKGNRIGNPELMKIKNGIPVPVD